MSCKLPFPFLGQFYTQYLPTHQMNNGSMPLAWFKISGILPNQNFILPVFI